MDTYTSATRADVDTFSGVVYGFDLRSMGWVFVDFCKVLTDFVV